MTDSDSKPALSRRRMFAAAGAAGAAGALAAAAASLPRTPAAEAQAKAAEPQPDKTGYRLTEHIQRYYQTAKV